MEIGHVILKLYTKRHLLRDGGNLYGNLLPENLIHIHSTCGGIVPKYETTWYLMIKSGTNHSSFQSLNVMPLRSLLHFEYLWLVSWMIYIILHCLYSLVKKKERNNNPYYVEISVQMCREAFYLWRVMLCI